MPRIPKPYPHKGWYRTNAGGKRGHPLCRIEEGMTKARRVLNVYLGQQAEAEATGKARKPVGSGIRPKGVHDPEDSKLAGEVHDEYLDVVKSENEPSTYKHYLNKLKPFVERFGHLPIAKLTERDGLTYKQWLLKDKKWVKGGKKVGQKSVTMKGVGPTTCNHFLRAAKTLLNWAAKPKRRYIASNPWSDIKLLQEKPRERIITDEEFRHLMKQASDDDFRELLFFMRHTTARPGETRQVEWDMVHWDIHRIVLDSRRVKTRNARTLTMLPEVEEMLRKRQARTGGQGCIFLNAGGGEWGGVSFSQRFRRLRNRCVRLGLIASEKTGEKLVLYSTRHTRITEMLREGVGLAAASKEAGHKNASTTDRHYSHLSDSDVAEAVLRSHRYRPPASDDAYDRTKNSDA